MWTDMWQDIYNWFSDANMWKHILFVSWKIILIIIIAQIVLRVLQKTVGKMIVEKEENPLHINLRRSKTVGKLVNNIITYAVNFIMALMILNQLGIQVGPILAGAGVVGIAIGFGAQSLVRDILTGFFIIFEDQFAVGDVIQTGTFKGTVEEIGLRVTTIKSATGEVHIIPNGSIVNVTNFSIHNTVSTLDIPLDSSCDLDAALTVIRQSVQQAHSKIESLVHPPEVLGVHSIAGGEIIVRISIETKANAQFAAMRQLNEDIKKSLDAHHIMIASGAKK